MTTADFVVRGTQPLLVVQYMAGGDLVDPGNQHLVTWLWGYVTVGINEGKVKAALGSTPMPATANL